ncbi:Uncharacterised protein [Escherichia coli]|uniref:Uncharacterized protein n=1 Tax=Escherichia coli TaxID=562 RepID=A0A377KGH8_ECOLX|nr:Uncharacterised protein [Escherichia coli]
MALTLSSGRTTALVATLNLALLAEITPDKAFQDKLVSVYLGMPFVTTAS